jgi:hypothetical protein
VLQCTEGSLQARGEKEKPLKTRHLKNVFNQTDLCQGKTVLNSFKLEPLIALMLKDYKEKKATE